MRLKQLLSSVGMMLILGTAAFAADTQSAAAPASATKPAATPTSSAAANPAPTVVRNVSVVQGDGTINVEIATNGPITPKATRLASPARIVLDFPNSIPAGRNQFVTVDSTDVKDVRLAQFQADPPVVRIVVDMASARPYDLTAVGNKITLKLRSSEVHAAITPAVQKIEAPKAEAKTEPKADSVPATAVPTAQPVVAPAKTPAPKHTAPAQPVDAQDVVAKAQAKPGVVAASNPVAKPEVSSETKAADSQPVDFVMVNPTYAAKTDVAPVKNPKEDADAAARVIAVAAKTFPGQPVSNLASPVTAAMPAAPAGQQGENRQ